MFRENGGRDKRLEAHLGGGGVFCLFVVFNARLLWLCK